MRITRAQTHLRQYLPPRLRWGCNRGFTLFELMITLAILGILLSIAIPRAAGFLDSIDVRGAVADAEGLCNAARHLAIARAVRTSVDIDPTARTLVLVLGHDTVRRRDEGVLHNVQLSSTRRSVTYSPIGAGLGGSNLTLVVTKGAAAETLFVSRLGRVRR